MRNHHRLIAVAVALVAASPATATAAPPPVTLTAAFDRDARLGASTAVHIGLRIHPRRTTAPATRIRLAYPASLGITTSGLGIAACRRPKHDFERIVLPGDRYAGLAGCSPNAVMGRGIARARILLGGTDPVPEIGEITVLAGPYERGRMGLVAFVDGWNPFGAKLAYAGRVEPARAPFGGALSIVIPPSLVDYDVVVQLTRVQLTIGARDLRYFKRVGGKRVAYRPEGILLPDRCPRGGFRFRARVRFRDGSRARADAVARCPGTRAAPGRPHAARR